jgi:hypothetical protein
VTAPAKHLTIRNVPAAIVRELERLRRRTGASLNQTAIDSLGRALGVSLGGEPPDNGLGRLAGTWSDAEMQAFEDAAALFEKVDDAVWK